MLVRVKYHALVAVAFSTFVLALAGCSAGPTGPEDRRPVLSAPGKALHDDDPPTEYCDSGWIVVYGEWVCPD